MENIFDVIKKQKEKALQNRANQLSAAIYAETMIDRIERQQLKRRLYD